MSWYPDMGNESMVASGDHVRSVGWLSSDETFPQEDVSPEYVRRLEEVVALASESARALYFGAFGGFHTCELCEKVHDSRNLGIPAGELLFVAPAMVAHYVKDHRYKPPDEFIDAILRTPLPGTEQFNVLAAPFRRFQEQMFARWERNRLLAAAQTAFEQGGDMTAIKQAALRYFGHSLPEVCEQIRQALPHPDNK